MNSLNVVWAALTIGSLCGLVLIAIFAVWQWMRLRAYHSIVSRCGYLAPPPTPRALRFLQRFSKLLVWIQVGKIRYVNEEHLDTPGQRLVLPNHGSAADPLVFGRRFTEPQRYMAAKGVFDFGFGVGSLIAGPCGAFSADLTPGKGGPAKDAAVSALTSRQNVVMFPEGWAWLDGEIGPMKKGAVRIAKEAAQRLGEPVFLVPTYMRYARYPGAWIKRLPPPVQYLLAFVLAPLYRRGCVVVYGKPISSVDLPKDDAEGLEMLKQAIVACDPGKHRARELLAR